ncbi:MAG TPA: hypothetical protein DCQ31_16520 [Bacteroidales bacterium]|nr:hypothetical protein [Bacteroidales bacterium]
MKVLSKLTLIAFVVAAFFTTEISAQQMKTFTWTMYKTKFQVPSDFKIQKNDKTEFTAGTDDIVLTIYPRKGEELDSDLMPADLKSWALENELKNLGRVTNLDETVLNGYWGVFQEGTLDDSPVIVMLIVDPDFTDIGFYIWINYTEGQEDLAIKILESFTPTE